ncbi:phospholipase A [uncultured Campylobacter sp.]|mgnify:CR=1 FL=1|uniref:phospholipase A n=1 Tax=uncultured Campylobacter sp. TaxID=218934 RepID=UPI0026386A03|nr:phospholipase A [uncultured Campylobacter sp.]
MKFKALALALCAMSLAAQDLTELYAKASEYEAKGDYKNAMIYYKKIAAASLADKGDKPRRKVAENSTSSAENRASHDDAAVLHSAKPQNSLAQNSAMAKSSALNSAASNFADAGSAASGSASNLASNSASLPQNSAALNSAPQGEQNGRNFGFLGLKYYEPIYMLFTHDFSKKPDRKADELHFEFSFERPITYDALGFGEKISFAYAQNSWWQITQDSAPFRESNYRPELYVSAPVPFADELKIGAMHESNGKGGEESRSWNRLYAQSTWSADGFSITPRAWYAFWLDRTNEDIADYMGYGDLRASYTFGKQRLSALWRNNLHFDGSNRGAIELNYSFPIFNSGFYGYLRYFNGYGESLADYKRSVNKIGIGLSFVEF